ncbi:MAG: hypothetical protein Q8O67_17420 [Deltaproteobacteria bacterium]|nr:hypothetical protein [Deltaproteobacteria bacterium]
MSIRVRSAVLCAALFAVPAAATPSTTPPSPADKPVEATDWFSRMTQMSEALTSLLVDILPERRVRDRVVEARATETARRLAVLARAVHTASPRGAPDADPSIPIVASLFADEADRLARVVAQGPSSHARALARSVTSSCIGCHTRSDRMPELQPPPSTLDLSGLRPIDRADVLIATHRFAAARKELDALLANDRLGEEDPSGWERAVTHALLLEVRTQRSPDGALALVERVLNGPVPLARAWEDADGWRRSLLAWKQENHPWPGTPDEAFRDARRLIEEAEAAPRVPGDRSADVLYLRATAALHDFLASNPRGPAAARAFSLLSVSYWRLGELDLWSLARLYDEACIREAPHTDLAAECYERYDDLVRADEAGNGGRLSPETAQRLKTFRDLAGVAPRRGPKPR